MISSLPTILTHFFTPERIFFAVVGVVAFIIAWATGKALEKNILKKYVHLPKGYSVLFIPLAGAIVKNFFLVIGILALTSALGVNIASIVQVIMILGFGLSFILKDMLADVAAGFFILTYQPFHEGHELSINFNFEKAKCTGKIIAIDMRYTTLQNPTETILIPNSLLFKQPVIITR